MLALRRGLPILLEIRGVEATVSGSYGREALLTVTGPEKIPGDAWNRYNLVTPDGLPGEDDESNFALLYRELSSLVRDGKEGLTGPYADPHPSLYMMFQYSRKGSPVEMLELLGRSGIPVRVVRLLHKGDSSEFEQVKKDFARWIDAGTKFDPDPNIEKAKKKKEEDSEFEMRMERYQQWSCAAIAMILCAASKIDNLLTAIVIILIVSLLLTLRRE